MRKSWRSAARLISKPTIGKSHRWTSRKSRELSAGPRTQPKDRRGRQKDRGRRKTKASAEAEIRANPNNSGSLEPKGHFEPKAGRLQGSSCTGEVILRQDPDNVNAYLQIIKASPHRSAGDNPYRKDDSTGGSRRNSRRAADQSDGAVRYNLAEGEYHYSTEEN